MSVWNSLHNVESFVLGRVKEFECGYEITWNRTIEVTFEGGVRAQIDLFANNRLDLLDPSREDHDWSDGILAPWSDDDIPF